MKRLLMMMALLFIAAPASAGYIITKRPISPLVDTAWVKANSCKSGVVVLDIRGKDAYGKGHIPCARVTDYGKDGWRVKKDGVAGVLPPVAALENLIGGLGIGNNAHVVVVPVGLKAADFAAATRVYWTFKVLGHDKVSVLNGGMIAYGREQGNRQEMGRGNKARGAKFQAHFRSRMVPQAAEVLQALKNRETLLDSRPNEQYLGINKSSAVMRPGTITSARNLPALWTTRNSGGMVRSHTQLAILFKTAKIPTKGKQIVFCNTGHWASLGWFISSEVMGNKQARMYDGSLADWSRNPSHPMEALVKLQ